MSQATYREMIDEVLDFLSDHSPPAEALVKVGVNKHYDRFAKLRPWEDLENRVTENMATVANQSYLAFPEDCAIPIGIIDRTNDWKLVPRELDQQDEDFISHEGTSGDLVIHYARLGYQAIKAPLSAADELAVITELDADISRDIVITGVRNSPEIRDREVITTSAASPSIVSVSGQVTWKAGWSITSISAAEGLQGYVTIHEQATSGNVLAVVSEHNRNSRYFVIQLQNAPSSAAALILVYKRRVLPLKEDDDIPVIPISEAIVHSVIADMRRHDEQYTQAREHDAQADRFLNSVVAEQAGQDRTSHRSRPAAARMRRKPCR